MPLIRMDDLSQDLEDKALTPGKYDVRIIKSEYVLTKKGDAHQLKILLTVEGEEGVGAKPIGMYLGDPEDAEDSAAKRMKLRELKRFLTTFGIDFSQGFDMEASASDLVGLTANVTLTQNEYEGEISNRVQLPRIA